MIFDYFDQLILGLDIFHPLWELRMPHKSMTPDDFVVLDGPINQIICTFPCEYASGCYAGVN